MKGKLRASAVVVYVNVLAAGSGDSGSIVCNIATVSPGEIEMTKYQMKTDQYTGIMEFDLLWW